MRTYETLSEAIEHLMDRGYNSNLNIRNEYIQFGNSNLLLHSKEFEIDELHRFQEMSDVDNETILYAISSRTGSLKGLLVNAFGTYADTAIGQLATKLSLSARNAQIA